MQDALRGVESLMDPPEDLAALEQRLLREREEVGTPDLYFAINTVM
jgi:hypothetical protein